MTLQNEDLMRFRHRPSLCPACGSLRIATLLYGNPAMTEGLARALAAGRIVLGGSRLSDEDPAWACADCGEPFYPERDGEAIA